MSGILDEKVTSPQQLCRVIKEIGVLPLFESGIKGFSAYELTHGEGWFSGDEAHDPWEWRKSIAACGEFAYGKFIKNKAAFISRELVPEFVCARREKLDARELYEIGKMSHKAYRVMELFESGIILPSYEARVRAGFVKGGETGFEGAISSLQMQLLLTVRGYERKRNRQGEEYGWPVGFYSTPESLFSPEYVLGSSNTPRQAGEFIVQRLESFFPEADRLQIEKIIL